MMANHTLCRSILAGLLLSTTVACGGPVNRGLESVHIPTVTRTDMAYDVPASVAGLSDSAQASLDAWFNSIQLRYGDQVTVDDANTIGAEARAADIARVVARHGLLLGGTAPVTEGVVPSGSVRVIVTRASATVENCPNWERRSSPELAGSTTSNFGCAVRSNLAAMIADPNDLLTGQPYEGSEATATVKAVKAWRDKEVTGSKDLETTSAGDK